MRSQFRVKPYAHSEYKFVVRAKINGQWKRRYFRTEAEAEAFADEQNNAAPAPSPDTNSSNLDRALRKPAGAKRHRAIVVLGMHRSGTSALARALAHAGVPFGRRLMAPAADNEKGFWEQIDVVRTHNKLLAQLRSSWDDERPLPANWENSDAAADARSAIIEVLEREFGQLLAFGVKDPRLSRLWPLWEQIFLELNIEPYFVLMLRHPWEVAQSLARRNSLSPSHCHVLWLRHTLEAEMATRGYGRSIVSFAELLDDPQQVVGAVLTAAGLPPQGMHATETVRDSVELSMQHHRVPAGEPTGAAPAFVSAVYETLLKAPPDGQSAAVASLHENFTRVAELFEPRVAELTEAISASAQEAHTQAELMASLQDQRETASRVLRELEQENDRKTEHISSLDRRIESLSRDLSAETARFALLRAKYAARLVEAHRRAAESGARNAAELLEARWELLSLRAESIRGSERTADAETKLADAESRANAALSQREQLRGVTLALTRDLEQEQLNVAAVQHRYALAEENIAAAYARESTARDEAVAVRAEFAALEAARDGAIAELRASEQRLRDLEQQIFAAEDRLYFAESNLHAAEQRAAASEDQLQTVQEQWAATQEQLRLAGNELADRRAQLLRVRKQLGHRLILPFGDAQQRIYELTS